MGIWDSTVKYFDRAPYSTMQVYEAGRLDCTTKRNGVNDNVQPSLYLRGGEEKNQYSDTIVSRGVVRNELMLSGPLSSKGIFLVFRNPHSKPAFEGILTRLDCV